MKDGRREGTTNYFDGEQGRRRREEVNVHSLEDVWTSA
jgi:hypothetical protein